MKLSVATHALHKLLELLRLRPALWLLLKYPLSDLNYAFGLARAPWSHVCPQLIPKWSKALLLSQYC
jgi:hypothetical protein